MTNLDVGWRRYGQIDAALGNDTHYDFYGTYGGYWLYVQELIGVGHNPVCHGREYVNDSNVRFDTVVPPGSTTYVVLWLYTTSYFTVWEPWEVVGQYLNGWLLKTNASGPLPQCGYYSPFNATWGGGYITFTPGGTVRQSWDLNTGIGFPTSVSVTTPVLLNSYILSAQVNKTYFLSGGGQSIPPGPMTDWFSPTTDYNWGTYSAAWVSTLDGVGGEMWARFDAHIVTDGTAGVITEGWMTEVTVSADGQYFEITGCAARGTLKAYTEDGILLTRGVDWEPADTIGKTFRILTGHTVIMCTYLNMAKRLQRGVRNVRLSQSNTFHDRRRFSDIRGL